MGIPKLPWVFILKCSKFGGFGALHVSEITTPRHRVWSPAFDASIHHILQKNVSGENCGEFAALEVSSAVFFLLVLPMSYP